MNSFGLTRDEYIFVQKNLIFPLKNMGGKIWIFGSRARGSHQLFSDIDLLVDGPAVLEKKLGSYQEFFQKSNFPYKIDLVWKPHLAKTYAEQVLKEQVEL